MLCIFVYILYIYNMYMYMQVCMQSGFYYQSRNHTLHRENSWTCCCDTWSQKLLKRCNHVLLKLVRQWEEQV